MADNHARLQARFNALPLAIREAVRKTLEQNARELVREMVRRAPEDDGYLKESIRWVWGAAPEGTVALGAISAAELGDISISIVAGNEATMVTNSRGVKFQNALLQEYGTKGRDEGGQNDMPANPYFRPAYRALSPRFRRRMATNVNKAIREIWDG